MVDWLRARCPFPKERSHRAYWGHGPDTGGRVPTEILVSSNDLERLIAAEALIAARTAEAAGEARALVAAAQARAEQAERRLEDELGEAIAELEREVVLDRERQLGGVANDLDRELRALQAVSEERITELARKMLDLLLESGTTSPGK